MNNSDKAYDAAIAYATAEGVRHGKTAASWYFDGNTTDATYRAVLKGLDDGDPLVVDGLPFADLSGQWGNTLTGPQLVEDAIADSRPICAQGTGRTDCDCCDDITGDAENWFSDICDAYENAFNNAAQFEIERVARYHILPNAHCDDCARATLQS